MCCKVCLSNGVTLTPFAAGGILAKEENTESHEDNDDARDNERNTPSSMRSLFGKVTTWHHSRWLVVDATFESSWAPIHKLDSPLGLDGRNCGIDILGHDISSVHHAACHVFAMAWVALCHHVCRLETSVGDFGDRERLVVRLLSRDDWRIRGHHEVNPWVWHKIGLELGQVDIQCSIEAQGSGEGRDHLCDEAVEIGVGGALNVQATTADVIQRLVVKHHSHISVLQEGVGGKDSVVWLHNSSRHLRGWVDAEPKLGLLAIVNRKTLQQERPKARAGATSNGVEQKESLQAGALVCKLADAVEGEVDNLFAHGVMSTSVVVGGIFLSRDELLRVIQLAVGTRADLVNHSWLEIEVDATGDVFAGASLRKERVEGVVTSTDCLVGGHLAVRLDAMFEAVQLPASVSALATALANVDGDSFAHDRSGEDVMNLS